MFALCRLKHRGLLQGTPGNFDPKWPTPCCFERRRHSIANCGRIVNTDSATVTHNGNPIEITIALSNGTIADPRPPLLHKIGVPDAPRCANGHISATGNLIHFMFGSRQWCSASASKLWPQPRGFWPRPGLDFFVLLCNRAFFVQKSCKIPEFS